MQLGTRAGYDPSNDVFDAAGTTQVTLLQRTAATDHLVALIDRVLLGWDALTAWHTLLAAGELNPLLLPDPGRVRLAHTPTAQPVSAEHLERCLEQIQAWLGIGLADACRAAGIDRGTVYAWRRRGSAPRPGTVGAVLRLHGLIASAIQSVGEVRTRDWFHTGDPAPIVQLTESGGDQAVITAVGRSLRRTMTGPALPPPNPLLAATLDDSPARPLT